MHPEVRFKVRKVLSSIPLGDLLELSDPGLPIGRNDIQSKLNGLISSEHFWASLFPLCSPGLSNHRLHHKFYFLNKIALSHQWLCIYLKYGRACFRHDRLSWPEFYLKVVDHEHQRLQLSHSDHQ